MNMSSNISIELIKQNIIIIMDDIINRVNTDKLIDLKVILDFPRITHSRKKPVTKLVLINQCKVAKLQHKLFADKKNVKPLKFVQSFSAQKSKLNKYIFVDYNLLWRIYKKKVRNNKLVKNLNTGLFKSKKKICNNALESKYLLKEIQNQFAK